MTGALVNLDLSPLHPTGDEPVEPMLRALSSRVRATLLDVAWRQWRALGAPVVTTGEPLRSLVDAEALILLSIRLVETERRLVDVLGWWSKVGSSLLSVQRLRNLSPSVHPDAAHPVAPFAALAVAAGDRRWRSLVADESGKAEAWQPRSGKGTETVRLHDPAALMLRLRAGCGVGVKADLLTLLLGKAGRWVTVREASEWLGYTDAAVRLAGREMGIAGFIETTGSGPAQYRADGHRWAPLLADSAGPAFTRHPSEAPAWRHGSQVFSLLTAVLAWADKPETSRSRYLASTTARDLTQTHRRAWEWNGLKPPDGSAYRGGDYLDAFDQALSLLIDWVQYHA